MNISVISDSHDNIWKLEEAILILGQTDAEIHYGDIIAPFVVKRLAEGLGEIPVHIVWKNNDGDKRLLSKVAEQAGIISIHGDFAKLELGGKHIAINHYPEISRAIAMSGNYDLVCFGHDHSAHEERIGNTFC
jgi:putative phosphoesterase